MNRPSLHFSKLHGTGNDFVIFDNRKAALSDQQLTELTPRICNRRTGVGADVLIALQSDISGGSVLELLYKNPDVSDDDMFVNGKRCVAEYVVTHGSPTRFPFRVHNRIYHAKAVTHHVTIEFPLETVVSKQTAGEEAWLNVYTNTDHIVCQVQADELEQEQNLVTRGRQLRNHPDFQPLGTNVNFISGIDAEQLKLQTYERGVEDLTPACGTGAIASALSWHHLQQAGEGEFLYTIHTRGGELKVYFSFCAERKLYHHIRLEGAALFVFEGDYYY